MGVAGSVPHSVPSLAAVLFSGLVSGGCLQCWSRQGGCGLAEDTSPFLLWRAYETRPGNPLRVVDTTSGRLTSPGAVRSGPQWVSGHWFVVWWGFGEYPYPIPIWGHLSTLPPPFPATSLCRMEGARGSHSVGKRERSWDVSSLKGVPVNFTKRIL